MSFPIENAFTINSLAGDFFPLSLKVSTHAEVTSLFICAQRAVDLCDLVEAYAKSQLVLFGVGQTSVFDESTDRLFSLEQLAAAAQIPFTAVDSETLVLPKGQLLPLLKTFDHYNLNFFDIDSQWTDSQIINEVFAYRDHDWQSKQVLLPNLSGSNMFLSSHDDCYLTLESRAQELAKGVFTRTLQSFTETLLAKQNKLDIELSDFPMDLLNLFWTDNFGLSLFEHSSEIAGDKLRMGVSLKPFSFNEPSDYPLDFLIVFEMQN